jgi:hypothetical protein
MFFSTSFAWRFRERRCFWSYGLEAKKVLIIGKAGVS